MAMQFTNAQGVAAEYPQNGVFDKEGFVKHWHQEQQLKALSEVAKQYTYKLEYWRNSLSCKLHCWQHLNWAAECGPVIGY